MSRSQFRQFLGVIIVLSLIFLAITIHVCTKEGTNNDPVQQASILAISGFGGGFGGTTLFWLLFECDFSRGKKMRRMKERIENIENNLQKEIIEAMQKEFEKYFKKKSDNEDSSQKPVNENS